MRHASKLTASDCLCMVRKLQFCTLLLSYYWFRESIEAFLNMILCNNGIREMLCVHTADTKAKDLLDFSVDIFHLHFVSQNSVPVCQQ